MKLTPEDPKKMTIGRKMQKTVRKKTRQVYNKGRGPVKSALGTLDFGTLLGSFSWSFLVH